ncbi:hypothetical protein DL766_007326 [Monosporascus sp. MC13-8B]|uniref:Uncharacterized protein n=1 Tax=Monosporascus cannonballus TaxID=155416 RepID=A0ABY0GVT2_9PEZI|nr:hypothetical protein DL762_010166 [Monosporascus cannonballus]RYP24254.1 hypothetical protein DL766_007326 [Monosporascus sp. MC13-8B]
MTTANYLPSRLISRDTGLSSIFRKDSKKKIWRDPEKSVGRFICKVGRESIWEAQGEAREAFKALAPEIKDHLDMCVDPISSWVTWSIYMMGIATQTATPTIIFCCEVALHRREVRNIIKNSGILDRYPGIKTGHMPRAPDFDRLVPLALGADNWTTARISIKPSPDGPGSQLVIEWSRNDMEWSTKATVGGVIRVRNKYFYTTAAHTFQHHITASRTTKNFDTDIFRPSDEDCCSFDGDSETEVNDEESAGSACEFTELGSYDDKLETLVNGKTIWDNPADQNQKQLIQDNPTAPDRAPPLDSDAVAPSYDFEFDHPREVFIATLKRPETGLDYALIAVEDPRHCTENTVTGVSDPQFRIVIKSLARELSDNAAIIAVTPRGMILGNLSATPSYVRTPDGKKFHEMFTAKLDAKLESLLRPTMKARRNFAVC